MVVQEEDEGAEDCRIKGRCLSCLSGAAAVGKFYAPQSFISLLLWPNNLTGTTYRHCLQTTSVVAEQNAQSLGKTSLTLDRSRADLREAQAYRSGENIQS
jgi:hypothetical protein